MQLLTTERVDSIWKTHALYYLPTAIWPLVHMRSFEAVSGPKTDHWLVKTVAALLGVVGLVIGRAGLTNRITPEVELLAVGTCATLTTIDVVYVSRGRISRIYLLEALAEIFLIAGWTLRRIRRSGTPSPKA